MKLLPGTTREWIDLSVDGPFLDAANLNDHEAKFRAIDALLQCSAIALQNDPPSSPAQDAVYVVGPTPTGVWAAHANKIARFGGVDWELFSPTTGWKVAVGGIDYRWSGSAWIYAPSLPLESVSTLGLGVFGAAGQGTAYAYQILSNRGVGFQDARGVGWKGGFASSDAYFGIWQDANSSANFKPIVFGDSVNGAYYKSDPLDALFKHRLTGNTKVTGSVEISLNLQIAGINRITSTGEGQFSGLRLTNLSTGQIPVCSDGNSQITASGLTDDGTYFTSSRVFRAWNTLTKTGNTWSSMQWNQASEERVSIFSSDSSGSSGYHSLVFVPYDNEATNRELGHTTYGQKVTGKSGTNPGLKIVLSGRSVGSGGSTGGFGGQWGIEYRPDNGASLVSALRVGSFGSGDAVQADIMLRSMAGFGNQGLAAFGGWTGLPGSNRIGSGLLAGELLIVNGTDFEDTAGATCLNLQVGQASLMCMGRGIQVYESQSRIDNALLRRAAYLEKVSRTQSASTAATDLAVIYVGDGGHTETIPAATGSGRIVFFHNASSITGTWTLQRQGSDVIYDGGQTAPVTSIAISTTASLRGRMLMDVSAGIWVRLF